MKRAAEDAANASEKQLASGDADASTPTNAPGSNNNAANGGHEGVVKLSTNKSVVENSRVVDKAMRETYADLGLEETHASKARTRVHTNPLARQFATPHEKVEWEKVYADPTLPLVVDVGCAAGRFSLKMAKTESWASHNHLGLEIRGVLVTRACEWAAKIGLRNVHYIKASANSSLAPVLADYPGKVQVVAIQYPDPHFKKKHHKRRVLQSALVNDIARVLVPGGELFLQSDVEEIAAEMRDRATQSPYFERVGDYTPRDPLLNPDACAKGGIKEMWTADGLRPPGGTGPDYGDWMIGDNPLGVPTEREVANISLGNAVYRCLLKRTEKEVTKPPTPIPVMPTEAVDANEEQQ